MPGGASCGPQGRHEVQSGQGGEGRPVWALPASSPTLGSARCDGQFYQPHIQALLGEGEGGSSLERAGRV